MDRSRAVAMTAAGVWRSPLRGAFARMEGRYFNTLGPGQYQSRMDGRALSEHRRAGHLLQN
jgi:hypothetical protein